MIIIQKRSCMRPIVDFIDKTTSSWHTKKKYNPRISCMCCVAIYCYPAGEGTHTVRVNIYYKHKETNSTHMMRKICIHYDDEVASCMLHAVYVGSAFKRKRELISS